MADDFSFPTLPAPKKPPLTAQSTVVHVAPPAAPAFNAPSTSKPAIAIKEVKAEGRRNKVPLEKGFSQVDWLRLTRSGQDLKAGLGLRRDISMEVVRQHATPEDAWMVLSGRVYNITPYLSFHPGGAAILMQAAGRDGTALFQRYHPWVNGHALLEACLLGSLKVSNGGRSPLGTSSSNGGGSSGGGGSSSGGGPGVPPAPAVA